MAGNISSPGAVQNAHSSDFVQAVLMGPLARMVTLAPQSPLGAQRIKAIWRNETGDAT